MNFDLLTADQANARLSSEYGISKTVTPGDVRVAASRLQRSGAAYEGSAPVDLLDALALLATVSGGSGAVVSESIRNASRTYAKPQRDQTLERVEHLIRPYGGSLRANLV